MAYKGQQFHQYYLIKLQEGFGGDLLPWATDPDTAIYKELIRFNRRVVPQNSEIPEHAAARRAWQETLSRLQLSPSLSFTEIAESTKTNPIYGRALALYQRLYLYFLEETISVDKIPPFKMNEFVDHIEKKIIRARVANFYQSVQLLKLTRKKPPIS